LAFEQHIFLVRCWNEAKPNDPALWRGMVRDAGSGRVHPFQRLSTLHEVITALLDEADPEAAGDPDGRG